MYENKEERDALFGSYGKYTEVELLNKKATGFGWAVLVRDNFEDNRLKVVKLPNKPETTKELLAEAKILTKISQYLRHRNLISLFSVDRYVIEWEGKKQERWFIVLEFGGENLRTRLGRLGLSGQEFKYRDGVARSVEEVMDIGIQVAEGLRALHEFDEGEGQHIIHRDIKPENILIDKDGVARLADFGISKVVERLTQSFTVAGTPPYIAPEASRGRLKSTSDIYSFGIVLYEMATGQFPFRHFQDRFYGPPIAPHAVNPQVPPMLSDLIMKCLAWNYTAAPGQEEAERYQLVANLLQDLRRCYGKLHPVPPQYVLINQPGRPSRTYRDKNSGSEVRIFLYETTQPGQCTIRIAPMMALADPHIVSPQQTFESEDVLGVVLPVAPVRRPAPAGTPLPTGEQIYKLVNHVVTLCGQLEALHRLGIYHGLITPQNTVLEGDHWCIDQIWVGALAGLSQSELVLSAHEIRAGYLAPDVLQWQSPPTLAADIYGLGALLYGLLTGKAPMDLSAVVTVSHGDLLPAFPACSGMRNLAPSVSRRLEAVILKALQPEPANRHRSMEQLVNDLRACRWPDDVVFTLVEDAKDFQKQGKLVEAYEALDQALLLDPGSPDVHYARAEIYFLEGETHFALKENEKALAVKESAPTWFLQGQCLLARGRTTDAAEAFRKGLVLENSSRGRHLLAECLENTGQHHEALEQYETALHIAEFVERDQIRVQEIHADLRNLKSKLLT